VTTARRPRIALLVAPETSASVLYGLYDVLTTVGPMWPDMTAAGPGDELLEVLIVARSAEPLRCFGGIVVEPHAAIGDVGRVDAVVVCDMYTPIGTPPRGRFPDEIAWLRRMHGAGSLVASVCSGSLLLAEAGLLDGRSCAGHWAYRELFADAYPRVAFRPGAILELAHEPEGLVTTGGVTSWQELALYLIGRFCGPAHAARTAKVYLMGGHEAGQLPFAAMSRRVRVEDGAIAVALRWIDEHIAVADPVRAMAASSGLTPRTFARRFAAVTGRRPLDYVHAVRIERARWLLELGETAIDEVGLSVGYEDPSFFRRLFKRTTGMTPAAYRRKYAAIVPAAVRDGAAASL
jgi:transcriptional regulator GlxA family with amidase domain